MNHYQLSQENSFSSLRQLGNIRFWVLGLVVLFCLGGTTSYAQKNKQNKNKKNKKYILPYLKDIKTEEEIAEIYNKFDRFKYQIIGHFSNKDQVAAKTTEEPLQEFIVMPVLKDRPGEFWVYLEFFSPRLIGEPIDQRVEQYVQVNRDSFRMEVYYLKNPEKYVNAWKNAKFPKLDIKKDLVRGDGCDLIIAHQEDKPGTFKTVPPKEINCEMLTSDGPARYVDLEFELSDSQYLMWFHFYRSDKAHLKESSNNGLQFKRLKEEEMKHLLVEE